KNGSPTYLTISTKPQRKIYTPCCRKIIPRILNINDGVRRRNTKKTLVSCVGYLKFTGAGNGNGNGAIAYQYDAAGNQLIEAGLSFWRSSHQGTTGGGVYVDREKQRAEREQRVRESAAVANKLGTALQQITNWNGPIARILVPDKINVSISGDFSFFLGGSVSEINYTLLTRGIAPC
ncbi:MAG: hypothetical protein QM640_11650, partial [Niabella sp.]